MNAELLNNVIQTLNKITVSGKQNLDMLLGCIMVLEHIAKGTEENKEGVD